MAKGGTAKGLGAKERAALLETLQKRFEANKNRHEGIQWEKVLARLEAKPEKLASLAEMERTGGEPDVVGYDAKTGEYLFYDCAPESPAGRRSLCYDRAALDARKENKPKGSAVEAAAAEVEGVAVRARRLPVLRPRRRAVLRSRVRWVASRRASRRGPSAVRDPWWGRS